MLHLHFIVGLSEARPCVCRLVPVRCVVLFLCVVSGLAWPGTLCSLDCGLAATANIGGAETGGMEMEPRGKRVETHLESVGKAELLAGFWFLFGWFGANPNIILRAYSWFRAQGAFLAGLTGPYGVLGSKHGWVRGRRPTHCTVSPA